MGQNASAVHADQGSDAKNASCDTWYARDHDTSPVTVANDESGANPNGHLQRRCTRHEGTASHAIDGEVDVNGRKQRVDVANFGPAGDSLGSNSQVTTRTSRKPQSGDRSRRCSSDNR